MASISAISAGERAQPAAWTLASSCSGAVAPAIIDTTGGWVDVQQVGDRKCDHLAYRQEAVDWELWLGQERRLPCQLRVVYKNEPGQPATTVTYTDLDLAPKAGDETFTAKVPGGYRRVKIMRYGTVEGRADADAAGQSAPPAQKQPK